MQDAISAMARLMPKLTSDIEQQRLNEAVSLLDTISHPITIDDVKAMLSLLPADGDDAHGLNWTVLHAIEASPEWPRWDLLRDGDNEWVRILRLRLKNAGIAEQ